MVNQLADAGHLAPGVTHATPQTVQGSDLMRFAAAGDATLLIGGDLIVTVCQVCFIKALNPCCGVCNTYFAPQFPSQSTNLAPQSTKQLKQMWITRKASWHELLLILSCCTG